MVPATVRLFLLARSLRPHAPLDDRYAQQLADKVP